MPYCAIQDAPQRHLRAYGLAVIATVAAVAVTRVGWRFFAATPYAPLFGAVALVTHWGSGGAGVAAIALGTAGAWLAFPEIGPHPWHWQTLPAFWLVGGIGNRLIAGRNRAAAALRNSEAQLRATLEDARTSEVRLRQAQKMEAVGQLAAGVAHNFNNLLTVTMGYTEILLAHTGDPKLERTALLEIRKATERGAALTRQLLAYGRQRTVEATHVDVDRAVDGLREMLRRVVREDIKLTFDLGWSRSTVEMDTHDLEQIVLNLVMNARDALPAGGVIQVDVGRETIAADDRRLDPSAAPGDYVRLRVRDNGVGMTAEVQAHLFEPFFTTKEQGKGTGLGLAFVNGIARHAGGFVTVNSARNKGTTVSVFFAPAPPETETPPVEAPPPVRVPAGAATILLVEDEDGVREMTARMLRGAGHRVLPAASPSEAIALFGMYPHEVDLVVTDIVMPEMHGAALAAQLVARRPNLAVLFVSAYPDARPPRETTARAMGFLAKPFSTADLLGAIAELRSRP